MRAAWAAVALLAALVPARGLAAEQGGPIPAATIPVGSAPVDTSGERPWAKDVSPERQQTAPAAFAAGNAAFTESRYSDALAQYREALRWWDHPAVHYNAAVSLINLDQPLPAYEHLEAALAYGDAPLGEETARQALLYKKLLSAQLALLDVFCDEEGADVMLDGKALFRAPGHATRRLLPGTYQLVARKAGFLTETRTVQAPAGKQTRETLALPVIGVPMMHAVRRWPTWRPWAVLGAGALMGLVGVPLYLDARSTMQTFDTEIARLCPAGCKAEQLPSTVVSTRDRAQTENGVAVGLFVVGGVAAATSVVLFFLNQPHLEPDAPSPGPSVLVAPLAGADRIGLSAGGRF